MEASRSVFVAIMGAVADLFMSSDPTELPSWCCNGLLG